VAKPLVLLPLLAIMVASCAGSPDGVQPVDPGAAVPVRFREPAQRDAQAVADATAVGRPASVNAAWWGFDPADSTAALQSAIDSRAARVLVPDMGSPWIIRPVRLSGDQEIVLEDGVVIEAKKGEFRKRTDVLLEADAVSNLTLRGNGAVLRMHRDDYRHPPYERSEHRHALSLRSCRNVVVQGLRIESSGGDGIYLGRSGTRGAARYGEHIEIRDVVLADNYRQGISVVSVKGLLVERTVMARTSGTPPAAGIDLEPNHADELLQDIVLRGCRIESNGGAGLQVYLNELTAQSEPVSIRVDDTRIRSNRLQVWITPGGGAPRGEIRFRHCDIGWLRRVRTAAGFSVKF
jgi:hypothetical protein